MLIYTLHHAVLKFSGSIFDLLETTSFLGTCALELKYCKAERVHEAITIP